MQVDEPSDLITIVDNRNPSWFEVEKIVITQYGRVLGAIGVAVYCALLTAVAGKTRDEIARGVAALLGSNEDDVSAGIRLLEQQNLIELDCDGYIMLEVPRALK